MGVALATLEHLDSKFPIILDRVELVDPAIKSEEVIDGGLGPLDNIKFQVKSEDKGTTGRGLEVVRRH